MSNSGRKINYAVRPGKSIERKMMRDMFNRLSSFSKLNDYRYIGFGSKYFADFVLFHRYLDIGEMISIESDITNVNRYSFNRPYSSIQIVQGRSTIVLPSLVDSKKRTIYWLDYDGRFEPYMMEDVALIARNAVSGSVLTLSFNADPVLKGDVSESDSSDLERALRGMVEEKYVPQSPDARGWRTSKTLAIFLKNCVNGKIQEVLKNRNLSAEKSDILLAEQIMFFTYADGCEMATISFIFFAAVESRQSTSCDFSNFYFYRNRDEPFSIKTPNLTIKEIRHIMEVMPDLEKLDKSVFVEADAKSLWENYRYFPSFTEIESF